MQVVGRGPPWLKATADLVILIWDLPASGGFIWDLPAHLSSNVVVGDASSWQGSEVEGAQKVNWFLFLQFLSFLCFFVAIQNNLCGLCVLGGLNKNPLCGKTLIRIDKSKLSWCLRAFVAGSLLRKFPLPRIEMGLQALKYG
jgi:hypothetical protein